MDIPPTKMIYAAQMTLPRKCRSCVPGLDCEFVAADAPVVEEFFLDCPEAARTSALDVADAAYMVLRDVDVDLEDRAAVRACLLADPLLDFVARAIESGRLDEFMERTIKCARMQPQGAS
jgi:hypothetical protein